MNPRVSIVMNSYRDDPSRLRAAIRSYRKQCGVQLQLIVSTVQGDRAIRIAQAKADKVVVNAHAGIYSQLNAALSHVTGDWYAYASGNDTALPTKLADEIALCEQQQKVVCYSDFRVVNEVDGTTTSTKFFEYDYARHLRGNFVSDLGLVRRDILDKYSPLREQYANMAYWDFWLRVAEGEGDVFVYNSKPEWVYYVTRSSRHVQRLSSVSARQENTMLRQRMLADHRNKRE